MRGRAFEKRNVSNMNLEYVFGQWRHSTFIFQCSPSIWKMLLDSGAIQHSCFIFQYSPSILLKVSCCYDVAQFKAQTSHCYDGGGKLHVAFCESN